MIGKIIPTIIFTEKNHLIKVFIILYCIEKFDHFSFQEVCELLVSVHRV